MPVYGIVQKNVIGPCIVADTLEDATIIAGQIGGELAIEMNPDVPPYQGWILDGDVWREPEPLVVDSVPTETA